MAITDGVFTKEEFDAVITEKPELLTGVVETLSAKKFSIRDENQEKEYTSNLEKKHFSDFTSKTAPQIEKAVEELTGIKKTSADEKWYDYNARALKEISETSSKRNARVKELEATSNLTDVEKAQLAQLKEYQSTTSTEIETMKTNHSKELLKAKIENKVLSEVTPVQAKFKKEIPASAIKLMHENAVQKILNSASDADGLTVYKGEDGKVRLNKSSAAPLTALDIYTEIMADCIDTGKQQGGAGGRAADQDDGIDGIPSSITTKPELSKYLVLKGLLVGAKEYNDIYNKHEAKLARR